MANKYEVSSQLETIQNALIKSSVAINTNASLLHSEQQIRDIYKSYADKIKNIGHKLYEYESYKVDPRTVITKEYFDELFSDVYIDIQALYINMKYIDDMLDINLSKNKKFFNTLEKRIIELENKLDVARLNVNTIVAFDKVYFEGFNSTSKDSLMLNTEVDKKTGHLLLKPLTKKYLNKKYNIKQVTTHLYPVENEDGGVIVTTNNLNTFEESYRRDGLNDMLINGLWKEQVYTNEIPNLQLEINKNINGAQKFKLQTQGIVSYVDIEFKYLVDFNNIDIDLFGEFDTTVMFMLHKQNESDPWVPVKKLQKNNVFDDTINIDSYKSEDGFNILKFRNLELMRTKFLRIVFNQKNYELVSNPVTQLNNTIEKVNKDLSERRLDVIKLDGGSDGEPAVPSSYHYDSFSSSAYNIVEYANNVDDMIKKLVELFEPMPKIINTNFSKTLKYELGAWSINPILNQYSGIGKFESATYNYTDKSVVGLSLITKQQDIYSNTCNWYISDSYNSQLKAIIPNDELIRKEPIHVIKNDYYNDLNLTDGTIVQLDFPYSIGTISNISLYEDGNLITPHSVDIIPLSSRILYITSIKDSSLHKYVIKYLPAKFDIVNVFVLYRKNPYKSVSDSLEYNVIAPRESILKLFLDAANLKDDYTIKRATCTSLEYSSYFSKSEKNICISDTFYNKYKDTINKWFLPNKVSSFLETRGSYLTPGELVYNITVPATLPIISERIL